jgi:cyclopropane fatty-acyl-phospholipid synthase-like methyltransferase
MVKVVEKSWNEFWAAYWRIGDRHRIPGIFEWDRRLVEFIEDVCCLSPGARILDLGCGGGDQAKVFASKGYDVVGVDIAPSLVAHARDQFEHEGLNGTFLVGDMRRIDYEGEFDCCTILSGTFGFFGDEDDARLLGAVRRALKPGGRGFIMFLSANRKERRQRTWSETEGGWELSETWFDQETSTYRSRVFLIMNDGRVIRPKPESGYHANESIRCYTVPEMRSMLSAAGLTYLASYSSGDFSSPPAGSQPERPRDIVVAERLGTGEESFSQ